VGPDPENARRLTAQKVIEAIEKARTDHFAPYQPDLPMTVTIRMRTMEAADAAAQKPGVERLDETTVSKRVERQCDVIKWIARSGLNMPQT
jgi:D-aminopeptidase